MPSSKEEQPSPLLTELLAVTDKCPMCAVMERLAEPERAALMSVVDKIRAKNSTKEGQSKRTLTYQWLADTLNKHGFSVSRKQVQQFVRGECDC